MAKKRVGKFPKAFRQYAVVHHSDRGIRYASGAYVQVLRQHHMIPSMSQPANPHDNASCGSFLKTLKREEVIRIPNDGHLAS